MEFELIEQEQEKDDLFFKCIKETAQVMHTAALAKAKCKQAQDALDTNDKDIKWNTLQEYLHSYKKFINSLTGLTGLYVYQVGTDYYASITKDQLNEQLQTVIGFVYLIELLHSAEKESVKATLKRALKQTGQFTDEQLKLL